MAGRQGEATGPKRANERMFVPLVMLVAFLLLLAWLNMRLVAPYTGPRIVADARGGFLFYEDDPVRGEAAFYYHRIEEGRVAARATRVEGTLLGAALREDKLVLLLGTAKSERAVADFFSITDRKTLAREWCGGLEGLDFEPRHLARYGEDVFAFGPDREGTLRAARLEKGAAGAEGAAWRLVQEKDARLERATVSPAPPQAIATEKPEREPPPVSLPSPICDALEGDRLVLLYRVARAVPPPRPGERPVGVVRTARFDGHSFSRQLVELEHDLVAFAATATVSSEATAPPASAPSSDARRVLVFSTKRGDQGSTIDVSRLEGEKLETVEQVDYRRGGILEGQGVAALAVGPAGGRLLLCAQIGGSIRVRAKEGKSWGNWDEVSQTPREATALIYGLAGAVVALSAAMVLLAAKTLRDRARAPLPSLAALAAAARRAAAASGRDARDARPRGQAREEASIHERTLAFGIDLAIVLGVLVTALQALGPSDLLSRVREDPTGRVSIALGAWGAIALVVAFAGLEAALGRTPGKRMLGLEVRDAATGAPPTRLALVYRNLFRFEVVLGATVHWLPVIPLLSLLFMLATPRTQRPGDLIAGTVVLREGSGRSGGPDDAEGAPREGEEGGDA